MSIDFEKMIKIGGGGYSDREEAESQIRKFYSDLDRVTVCQHDDGKWYICQSVEVAPK